MKNLDQHIIQEVHKQFDEIRSTQKIINDTVEKAWNIIQTLSPQSIPIEYDNDLDLERVKKFYLSLFEVLRRLDILYDKCPFPDNHKITINIECIRSILTDILNETKKIMDDY